MARRPLHLPLFVVNIHAIGKIEKGEDFFIFKIDKDLYIDLVNNFEEAETDIMVDGVKYAVLNQLVVETFKYSMVKIKLEVVPL